MKIRSLMVLLAMLAVYSCNDDAKSDITLQNQEVNISFAAQTDVVVKADTKAAVSDLTTASKFTFYAFKKGADGNYSFAKKISDASATYTTTNVWKSDKALLSVGTYRFICFYNLSDANIVTEDNLTALGSKSWTDIKNGIVIEHLSPNKDKDMDEFFCGESDADIQVNNNDVTVSIDPLKRVVSRIDVKFVKIAEDGNEVKYSDGHTIFGASDNLQTIMLDVVGAAKKYSLGTTPLSSNIWTDNLKFTYNNAALQNLVVIGESLSNSTFPTVNSDPAVGNDYDDIDAMKNGIIKGSAYFRGAYILPFMEEDNKLSKILINLSGKEAAQRTIEAGNLSVEENYITLVTVKLKSSTATGPGAGNDDEHLFNPKVKFTVTIDKLFAGVHNSNVEVE